MWPAAAGVARPTTGPICRAGRAACRLLLAALPTLRRPAYDAPRPATPTLCISLCPHSPPKTWALQWFALSAAHVDLVLADTEVDASLRAHCRTMWEPQRGEERECYSGGPGWLRGWAGSAGPGEPALRGGSAPQADTAGRLLMPAHPCPAAALQTSVLMLLQRVQ